MKSSGGRPSTGLDFEVMNRTTPDRDTFAQTSFSASAADAPSWAIWSNEYTGRGRPVMTRYLRPC